MELTALQQFFLDQVNQLKTEGVQPTKCRSCNASIYWVKTQSGKAMPVDDDDSGKSHFSTCPNANNHRKKK